MLLTGALWFLFQIPKVQTYTAKKVANYYSEKLETNVEIESLTIDFWDKVTLSNFFIEDLESDTLAKLDKLIIDVELFSYNGQEIKSSLALEGGKINLLKRKGDNSFNYQFLVDYFSPSEKSSNAFTWDVSLSQLTLRNAGFSFHDYNFEEKDQYLDFFHIDVTKANLNATDIYLSVDTLNANVEELNFLENKGFQLDRLRGNARIANGFIEVEELTLETPITALYGDILFNGESFATYNTFIDDVEIEANFNGALIDSRDLVYFIPNLEGLTTKIYLDGKVNGTLSNLKGNNVEIVLNRQTFMTGDFALRGLPDFENTFIFLDLEEFRTSAASLRKLPLPPFNLKKTINVPPNFDELGTMFFTGNFTGYLNDFVAYGNFTTSLGKVKTDIQLRENSAKEFVYSGKLQSESFDIGSFLNVKNLGDIALNVKVDGTGLTKKTAKTNAEGNINSIVYKGYNYQNIKINGAIKNETFSGQLEVDNENIKAQFNGVVDVNNQTPVSNFNLKVNHAYLAKLNLFNQQDSTTAVSFSTIVNIKGNNVDNFSGYAKIDSLSYVDSKLNHLIESVDFEAHRNGLQRAISITSSVLDANVSGIFEFKKLGDVFKSFANEYIPNTDLEYQDFGQQSINLEATLKNTTSLTEVLMPDLEIDSGLKISANLNSEDYISKLKVNGDLIRYKTISIEKPDLDLGTRNNLASANFSANKLSIGERQYFRDIWVSSSLRDSVNQNLVKWSSFGNQIKEGRFNIENTIQGLQNMAFTLEDSYFLVNDIPWDIKNENSIALDSGALEFQEIVIGNLNQQISLNGRASKLIQDTLEVELKSIDLEFVAGLLPENSILMSGTANGTSKLVGVYDNLSLTTGLELDSLEINNVFIGKSNLQSIWDSEKQALIVNGNLGDLNSDILTLEGQVFPLKTEESLDLSLQFKKFPLPLIKPYLVDYLSEIEGELNGEIDITGQADQPQLRGELDLENAFVHFNYLNTDYTINDKIIIEPDFIGFNLIKVKDSEGSYAIATGTIFHENYTNFNYDIGLEFENFLSLNTNSSDNDLYYGKGVTSGTGNIAGFENQLIIELDLKTEKGTDFKIPLTEGVDVSSSDFIIFTNSPNYSETLKKEVDLSGIQMNFDLEITPAAKVQIIFDEQVGDIIKATGEGELKLEINTIGDFNIFGQYVVEKGDYLFTLQNVINKRFEIANGSSIYWDGSPYDAVLDMQAIYNLRAPLYDLFPEDSTAGFKRRTPVELELQLSEQLLSPEISFDIRLPSADENTKRRLESILYVNNNDVNPQEMNQQVFGLLVLNRFLPSASSTAAADSYNRGTPGLNNGFEFVSNQLSNWASRLSDQFDVGVKYRPADELNSDEVDLSLSTEIFNDRLILDGNLGYAGESAEVENPNSGFIGEFTAEYKISRDGRYRVKGFNRSVSNSLLQLNSPYTQGVGLFYREEFDRIGELWKKYFGKKD